MATLDSSYTAHPPVENNDPIADKIADKLKHNLFEDAYQLLKTDVDKNARDLTAEEKEAYYKNLITDVEAKEKGGTTKLSAMWLKHLIEDPGKDNIKISKSTLTDVSSKSWSPINRGMAAAILKDFDIVDDLETKDGVLDKTEANRFVKRQSMAPREEFASKLIAEMKTDLKESPTKAYDKLISRISDRAQGETPGEDLQTWQQVANALKDNDMVSRLSMEWLSRIKSLSADGSYTLQQLQSLSKGLISPIHKQFADYIMTNWQSIASVDYPAETIQPRELDVYERKQMQK